jgi:hypothetical protein
MKSLYTLTGILIVITAIGALFYGGYLGLIFLWQVFAELEFVVRTVLLSAMSVIVIGALIVASAIKTAGASEGKQQLAIRKLDLYKSLIDIYKPVFESAEPASHLQHSDVLSKLRALDTEMQLLSVSQVLTLHSKLTSALQNRENHEQTDSLFRQLIKAIRRDLGQAPGYDESKLKFLLIAERKPAQRPADQEVKV